MELFRRYLRQHRLAMLVFVLCCALLAGSFALYQLPLAAVAYPAALCLLVCAAAAAWDYARTVRRHRRMAELRMEANAMLLALPAPDTIGEADCMAAIETLRRAASERETANTARHREMVDYYTAWVHQIKTPIAAMRLTLQCEDQPLARSISSELLRIEQYVQMAMTYLRLDSDETDYAFRTQPLDPIIRQAVRRFSGEFILRKLRLEYEPVELTVVTDEKWLTFVLEQLLSNALKYTRAGSIRIYLQNGRTLCIADTGIGIAPEDLPRIFEKGFTGAAGRAEQSASGLGLYLCRRICGALNIAIRAGSTLGAGTTVFLTLPDAPGRAE